MQLCLHICLQAISTVTGTLVNGLGLDAQPWVHGCWRDGAPWELYWTRTLSITQLDTVSGICLEEHLRKLLIAFTQLYLGESTKQEISPDDTSLTLTRSQESMLHLLATGSKLQFQLHNKWAEIMSTNSQAKIFQVTQPLLTVTSIN